MNFFTCEEKASARGDPSPSSGKGGSGTPPASQRTSVNRSLIVADFPPNSGFSPLFLLKLYFRTGNSTVSAERYSRAPSPRTKIPTFSLPATIKAALPLFTVSVA